MAQMNAGVVYAYDLGRKAEAIKSFEKYLELARTRQCAEIRGRSEAEGREVGLLAAM